MLGDGEFFDLIGEELSDQEVEHDVYFGVKHEVHKKFDDYDMIVTASFGHIFRKEEIGKHNIINLHPSALPMYKGCSPIQHQLKDGLNLSVVSLIKTNESVDGGTILRTAPFEMMTNYVDAISQAGLTAGKLLIDHIKDSKSYTGKIRACDVELLESDSFKELNWKINGTHLNASIRRPDGKLLKIIGLGEITTSNDNIPFGVLHPDRDGMMSLGAGRWIRLYRVQLEGKKSMGVRDYMKGLRLRNKA